MGWAISQKKWVTVYNMMKKSKYKKSKSVPNFFRKYLNNNFHKKKGKKLWSLKFIYENYISKKKYIYPNFSLVKNIGFDGTGVNSKITNRFDVKDRHPKQFYTFKKFNYDKNLSKNHNKFFEKNIKYFY